jgi:hypothetical protein
MGVVPAEGPAAPVEEVPAVMAESRPEPAPEGLQETATHETPAVEASLPSPEVVEDGNPGDGEGIDPSLPQNEVNI